MSMEILRQAVAEFDTQAGIIRQGEQELLTLRQQIGALQTQYEGATRRLTEAGEVITGLHGDIDELRAQIVTLQARIRELEAGEDPEDPTDPVPEPDLDRVPFNEGVKDTALLNFAQTAVRNWNFGGHNVPVPFAVDQGYWEYGKQADPWLFDRPSSFFKAYELSGDPRLLKQAQEDLTNYASHIDAGGYFDLKLNEKDTKYLYLNCFRLHKKHGGDLTEYMPVIERIYTASKAGYDPAKVIKDTKTLWTEREAAIHMETAFAYHLITGNEAARNRATSIISQMKDGLQRVTYTLHEGGGPGGSKPDYEVSSPWMMALYFQAARMMLGISQELDTMIYTQAANYGEWMVQPYTAQKLAYDATAKAIAPIPGATFQGFNGFAWGQDYHIQFKGVLTPRYLTGPYFGDGVPQEEHLNHALEVWTMMQFCREGAKHLGRDTTAIDMAINELGKTGGSVERAFANMTRTTSTLPKYRLKPARMWNWWMRGRYEQIN